MVMNMFTPLGAIDSASNNDYIGALMSLLPLGMADDVGRALKYDDLAKMFPLKFDEVKRLNNFNISNGRIVASRKGPMTADKAKELYESSPEIQKLVDQGFNVNSKGYIVTPDASTFSTVDEYINAARQRARVLKHRSYQDSWKTTRNNIGESQELLYESLGPQGYREVIDAAKTSGNKAKSASGYIHPSKLMK